MKPRPDLALLKRQTKKRQEQLWHWLNGDPEKKILPLSHRQVVSKIKSLWRIKVSGGQLSGFYSWYSLEQNFQKLDTQRTSFEELLLKKFPDLDSARIQEFGQALFTMQAAARGDPEEFREMEYLRLRKEQSKQKDTELTLMERKVVVLERKIEKAKEKLTKVAKQGGLSPAALKQIESAAKILT